MVGYDLVVSWISCQRTLWIFLGVFLENLARSSLKLLHFLGVFVAGLAEVGGFDGFSNFVGFIFFCDFFRLRD